jgi:hypothetical protein
MSTPHPAPDAPEPATDPAIARAERRLGKLDRLSDKGLEMTEALSADGSPASAESFAKLSRAVRLTITLEAKLDEALRARLAGESPKVEAARGRSAKDADDLDADAPFDRVRAGRRGVVRQLTVDVADREIPDAAEYDIFTAALDERLLYDLAYRNIDDLPLRDIVERLCADLLLKPDWSRWTGEGWKPNPPFFRPLASQFTGPSRTPLIGDDPDPDTRE